LTATVYDCMYMAIVILPADNRERPRRVLLTCSILAGPQLQIIKTIFVNEMYTIRKFHEILNVIFSQNQTIQI